MLYSETSCSFARHFTILSLNVAILIDQNFSPLSLSSAVSNTSRLLLIHFVNQKSPADDINHAQYP